MPFSIRNSVDRNRFTLHLGEVTEGRAEPTTIIIVDQDAAVRDALSLTLRSRGFHVLTYGSAGDVLRRSSIERECCLLIEFDLGDMNAIELVQRLKTKQIERPTIIMSARLRPLALDKFERSSIAAVLQKPFGEDTLLRCLRHVLSKT